MSAKYNMSVGKEEVTLVKILMTKDDACCLSMVVDGLLDLQTVPKGFVSWPPPILQTFFEVLRTRNS